MMKTLINIDVNRLNEEGYEYLKELFDFPDYFGNNLDALYDCLTDKCDLAIVYDNCLLANEQSKKIIRVINRSIHDLYVETNSI